jgi:DNA-binding Lrp family transcriptional regulator
MRHLTDSERRLLDAMQKDTTLSQVDLAELSGKSRTSVWRWVREVEEAGVIKKKVALLDPKELGLQIHVLLSVSIHQHTASNRQEFEDHVETLPEVMECYSVSGDRDYALLVLARDMEAYNQFLNA